ncbi:MAG: phosphoglucomutase/phosphomannomutase family protein [Trueperaceae bacterium]
MDTLTFGTDGWRDVIADKFTFANVARAAQAYADYLLSQTIDVAQVTDATQTPEQASKKITVLVGHDTRFMGAEFALHAAEVLAANGLHVLLSEAFVPTPALSYAVKHYGAAGGLMLTASHNPPIFHGFKLKGPYGGTATPDIYSAVSARVAQLGSDDVKHFDPKEHRVETFNIREDYYDFLKVQIDLEAIAKLTMPIYHEAVGGAGTGWLAGFFRHVGLPQTVTDFHSEAHPLFYGVNPEPLPQNLGYAINQMARKGEGIVMCSDGDADRIGVVLPGGRFFNSHQIFAVLLDHLRRKGLQGRVVKTFTVSRVIERLAELCGIEVVETPVGFKYLVDAMLEGDVLIAGEESGGIGIQGHIPERDSFLNALLLLETMATTGKTLDVLFAEIEQEVGWQHAYDRLDLHLSGNALKDAVMNALADPPKKVAERILESVERVDGVKLNLSGNAWLMFRASGTEPVLRIYCEAATSEEVKNILSAAEAFVESFKS